MTNVIQGFGISIVSNTDFDGNGYNDILVGSHLSQNALLFRCCSRKQFQTKLKLIFRFRSKPVAIVNVTNVSLKPNKVHLDELKCNNRQNPCFDVNYCAKYSGKFVRPKQMTSVTIEISDRKLRIRELRAVSAKTNTKSEQKSIEMKDNQQNCFTFQIVINVSHE